MRPEKVLRKIGLIIKSGNELTDSSFRNAGIKKGDISSLESQGIITKKPDDTYEVVDTTLLKEEVNKHLNNKDYENVKIYLQSLLAINPDNYEGQFQLFFINIINYNFDKAIPCLDYIYTHSAPGMKIYLNLYWLLLDSLTKLPEEYHDLVTTLRYSNLKVTIKNGEEVDQRSSDLENGIRRSILRRDYPEANRLSNLLRQYHKSSTTIDTILFVLINESIRNKNQLPQINQIDL